MKYVAVGETAIELVRDLQDAAARAFNALGDQTQILESMRFGKLFVVSAMMEDEATGEAEPAGVPFTFALEDDGRISAMLTIVNPAAPSEPHHYHLAYLEPSSQAPTKPDVPRLRLVE